MTSPDSHDDPARGGEHSIVVGVDGSAGAMRALEWAAREARRSGAALEVHTAYGPGYVLVSPHLVQESMKLVLDEAVARAEEVAPGVRAFGVAHEGSAVGALVAASKHADLLVVGSRGRGGFAELLLGSVSHHCVMHACCPVVIVRHLPADSLETAVADSQIRAEETVQ